MARKLTLGEFTFSRTPAQLLDHQAHVTHAFVVIWRKLPNQPNESIDLLGLSFLVLAQGLYSEVKRTRTSTRHVNLPQKQWAKIGTWKSILNFNAVGEKAMSPLRLKPYNSPNDESSWFCSGISGALVQRLSGRPAQVPCSLACTRPTTWAPFIQTAASNSLDYSTVLPLPAVNLFFAETIPFLVVVGGSSNGKLLNTIEIIGIDEK